MKSMEIQSAVVIRNMVNTVSNAEGDIIIKCLTYPENLGNLITMSVYFQDYADSNQEAKLVHNVAMTREEAKAVLSGSHLIYDIGMIAKFTNNRELEFIKLLGATDIRKDSRIGSYQYESYELRIPEACWQYDESTNMKIYEKFGFCGVTYAVHVAIESVNIIAEGNLYPTKLGVIKPIVFDLYQEYSDIIPF